MKYVISLFIVLAHMAYGTGEFKFTEEERAAALKACATIIVPNSNDVRLSLDTSGSARVLSTPEIFTNINQYLDRDCLQSLDQVSYLVRYNTRSYIKDLLHRTARNISSDQSIGYILHQLGIGYRLPQCSYLNKAVRALFGVLKRFKIHAEIPNIKLLHDAQLQDNMYQIAKHLENNPGDILVVDTGYKKLSNNDALTFQSVQIPNNARNLILLNMPSNVTIFENGSMRSHNNLMYIEVYFPEATMVGKGVLSGNKALKKLVFNMPKLFSMCPDFLHSCSNLEVIDTYLPVENFSDFYFFSEYSDFVSSSCREVNKIIVSHASQKQIIDDKVNKRLTKKIDVVVRETGGREG